MIEADGQVRLEMGMGSDGDLVGIIRRIIQCNTNSFNTVEVPQRAASASPPASYSTAPIVNLSNGCQLDISLINSLSNDQVENLLKDEDKLGKFMTNFQSVLDDQVSFLSELKREAKEKAQGNIELKTEIDGLAKRLDEMHRKYSETCQSFQNFMALNSSPLASLNPENILTQLQVNLMELNDSTNNSIRSALNTDDHGNLDLELKECIKMRKEYHKKAILFRKYQE